MANHRIKNGFSVVEALITVFAFSILSVIIAGIFMRSIQLQRRANAVQRIQENALFVLESMAREIRVSNVFFQNNSACALTTLNIVHPINGNITYALENGWVKRTDDGVPSFLNTSDVEFLKMSFCVTGSSLADQKPSKITIITSIRNRVGPEKPVINLQTTITSRSIQN